MVIALHGSSSLKILAIISLNFVIAKRCRASLLGPLLTWLFNGLVLFSNEFYHGYKFEVLPGLAALVSSNLSIFLKKSPGPYSFPGLIFGDISKMACHLQHHNASAHII
jgi:hypothetical protein